MRNLLVGALLACAAASAAAQQPPSPPGYFGAGIGPSRYHDFCAAGGGSCDEDGTAWRVQAGYMFRPWIGVEGAFIHFGEAHQPGFLLNPPPNTTPLPSAGDGRTYAFALSRCCAHRSARWVCMPNWATRRSRRSSWATRRYRTTRRAP